MRFYFLVINELMNEKYLLCKGYIPILRITVMNYDSVDTIATFMVFFFK